jgi:hypothetical protein
MGKVIEYCSKEVFAEILEANLLYDQKVSDYINIVLDERKTRSKSQKTALLSIIFSSFFIFDLIPALLPTVLFVSVELFSHMYQAFLWPFLSRQQRFYLYGLRVFVRIPHIAKVTPFIVTFFQWLFLGLWGNDLTYKLVLFGWLFSFTIFFYLLPWGLSHLLNKNGYYRKTILKIRKR